ncbi:MAG: hypothetical protein GX657_00090 [Chloroflexi bacterium]|nr:hypothetical protein [Chloroflexota bacterium]
MHTGCAFGLYGLGRLLTTLFFRLGTWIEAAFITTLVFLLATVIVPLLLGSTWEFLRWVFGVRDPRERPAWQQMGAVLFGLLSGVAWVGAFWIASLVWQLFVALCREFALDLGVRLGPGVFGVAITLALFVGGSVVGALAHRYQSQGPTGP